MTRIKMVKSKYFVTFELKVDLDSYYWFYFNCLKFHIGQWQVYSTC